MCDIAAALHVSNLVNHGWICQSDFPSTPLCNTSGSPWLGVLCDENYNVVAISLNGLGLTGTIPSSIGLLSTLQYLSLASNQILGTIPSQIGYLNRLAFFRADVNYLTGTIPASLGSLTQLQYIYIPFNYFSGTLPSSISNLHNIQMFVVSVNFLHGTIPTSIGYLQSLTSLYLSSNYFTGPIPSSIGYLTNLIILHLYVNPLTGSIPSSICNLNNMPELQLYQMPLSGSIPSCIGLMFNLVSLVIISTSVSGTIPSSFGYLSKITALNIYYSSVTGTIPSSLGSLSNLALLNLFYSCLTGTIPSSLGFLSQLTILNLFYNKLTGTIPTTVCLLQDVVTFGLFYNSFTGTIPSCLGMLSQLTSLDLFVNSFKGTIPSSLGYLTKLVFLNVFINQLSGTIPSSFANLSLLNQFNVFINQLGGPLPSISMHWSMLQQLDMANNLFTGSIPTSYGSLRSLIILGLDNNLLTGTIPSELGLLSSINNLYLHSNKLSGTIPTTFITLTRLIVLNLGQALLTGYVPTFLFQYPALEGLLLSSNSFIGTLPMIFTPSLKYIFLDNNNFSGTIAEGLLKLSEVEALYLNYNHLTGTLKSFRSMSNIRYLNLNKNELGGPLSSLDLNVTNLEFIDVSNNRFTGSISSYLFGPRLQEFAAASNCLDIVIPEEICNSRELRVIVLDGMHSDQSCRMPFFRGTLFKSYGLTTTEHRGIPECLYSMPKLNVLHLSGNVLTGTLPSDMALSPSIQDLTLSHNALHGPIPKPIQSRSWQNLDLSYNKLGGELSVIKTYNSTIALNVNRLSGAPPASLHDAQHINLLQGNLFSCDFNQKNLPSHDPHKSSYSCGSDSLEISFYVYLGLISLLLVSFVVLLLLRNEAAIEMLHNILNYTLYYDEESGFDLAMSRVRMLSLMLSVVILILLLPIYGMLGLYYGTHQYRYAWSVSVAYISGVSPAVILVTFWSFFLLFYYIVMLQNPLGAVERTVSSSKLYIQSSAKWMTYCLLVAINFAVTLVINGVYVNSALYMSTAESIWVQTAVGCMKSLWNIIYVENVSKMHRLCVSTIEEDELHDTLSVAMIVIINNIAIPCLAEAVADSNCFYNMIFAAKPVSVSYTAGYVCATSIYAYTSICYQIQIEGSTEYSPPFIYNYQCGSVLISNYTSVFVYTFLIISLWSPLRLIILVYMRNTSFGPGKRVTLVSNYCARLLSYLTIMMTFGVMFPPLAAIITVAIWIDTYCMQYMIHNDLIDIAGDVPDLHGTPSHFVGGIVALFYALILYDIVGDEMGAVKGLWAPCIVIVWPFLFFYRKRIENIITSRKKTFFTLSQNFIIVPEI